MAISKLTFVYSVSHTPESFTVEVNKLIFECIWKYKGPKIKQTTLTKLKKEGGLNMVDITLFDRSLNVSWIRRFCSEGNQPWKVIPLHLLSNVSGTLLFLCNYDFKDLDYQVSTSRSFRTGKA